MKSVLKIAVAVIALSYVVRTTAAVKNVLFLAVDDLRPELGTYGVDFVHSPNIDKLASKSIVFERAYCQIAVCSPSRASLLTGRRPDTNHVWKIANDEYWRTTTNATTIPQYFKENGYISAGMGKIFHPGPPSGNDDRQYSWNVPYFHAPGDSANHNSWHNFDTNATNLQDGKIADYAITTMKQIKENRTKGDTRPFFLAVGFHKPHLPFYCAEEFYNMYPPADQIELPKNPDVPKNFPAIARAIVEIMSYNDIEKFYPNMTKCRTDVQASFYGEECRIPDDYTRILRRAYYSCVSQTDMLIGKVVDAMTSLGLAEDTIIVLWADHGWQLGEHNHWCKHTNFEDATHVPFMLRVPGVTDKGLRTNALVELVDIFPTITELAGVSPPPLCPESDKQPLACVEGTSLTPLINNPDMDWKIAAFSQYPRPSDGLIKIPNKPSFDPSEKAESVMGYSVRVDQYRFTDWYRFNRTTGVPDFKDIWATELYNHTHPTVFFNDDNINMAADDDKKDLVESLRKIVQAGWRKALP